MCNFCPNSLRNMYFYTFSSNTILLHFKKIILLMSDIVVVHGQVKNYMNTNSTTGHQSVWCLYLGSSKNKTKNTGITHIIHFFFFFFFVIQSI